MRTGATQTDGVATANRPVIMPTVRPGATKVTPLPPTSPTARPGATQVTDYESDSDSAGPQTVVGDGEQKTGNMLWLWGAGLLIGILLLRKPRRR